MYYMYYKYVLSMYVHCRSILTKQYKIKVLKEYQLLDRKEKCYQCINIFGKALTETTKLFFVSPQPRILSAVTCCSFIFLFCSLSMSPFSPFSPQTLVPVARRGWHSQQAQQEPLWLPWRLQVFWWYQHGSGLLQAGRVDTLLLICIFFF